MQRLEQVSLIDTIVKRRSRRFALGGQLGPPLEYKSRHAPVPLSMEEEATIVFAGAGVTGHCLGELPYQPGSEPESGNGTIMVTGLGRTIASPDGCHNVSLFVMNDDGTFLMRRPQDYPKASIAELALKARRREFVDLYQRARIQISSRRADYPAKVPFHPPFNKWSANRPGSTYFVLVSELTTLYLTILFLLFDEEMGFFIFDERRGFRPAGIARFAKSKGGVLNDDPEAERVATVLDLESYLLEVAAVEQGLMLQNLHLATEALGLGGFPHYGAHRYAWFEALGFTMEERSLAQLMQAGRIKTTALNLLKKNVRFPSALGFVHEGQAFLKPYSPPWYPSMKAAVEAFVESKYKEGSGTFRDHSDASAWKDAGTIQAGIPEYSDAAREAVVAYSEYIYGRYGSFPGSFAPLRSLMAYSAHHIDTDFYDRYYKPGAYEDSHREHFATWHEAEPK